MKGSIRNIANQLSSIYDARECNSIARYIVEEISGMTYTDILVKDTKFSEVEIEKTEEITKRLLNGEPLQYILGYTYFCDLKIRVDNNVLIPRPETEEICRLIIEREHNKSPKILDVCTGSGCIALALKNGIYGASVDGVDISEGALEVAKENSKIIDCDVDFYKYDVIENSPKIAKRYDIIVSNPPYICQFEKEKMSRNVLDNEPHIALFVSDNDPLVFYIKIADLGNSILKSKGKLYFEINPLFVNELEEMLLEKGYKDIEIIKDINERNRFIACTKI
ncbi:MAG: peptide chain release factor N(5)-glutamine methyltransferase [Muribaculaceae bacterium]|nr:peptide chain release factor N(5)-glutamine methyltransferase [Muribaculaceae bacterium]